MLILINGASSSGKTSLARSLQKLWSGPLLYWSLDQVISQLPFSYTGTGEYSTTGFEAVDSDIYVRKHGYVLNDLSVAYIVSLANAGYDVVIHESFSLVICSLRLH
jgi:chloramphenicol 3-O phosphotransferase